MEIKFKCLKCGYISSNKYDLTCKNHSPYYSYFDLITPFEFQKSFFGEGDTSLVFLEDYSNSGRFVYAKCEYENPTGSVKDREVSAIFQFVLNENIKEVCMVSAGSGAKSAAAFSNKYGIKCKCIEIDCDYESIFRHVIDSGGSYNITPGINPFASEGTKFLAHELHAQLGNIDAIIVPVGNGTLLSGIWHGVKEVYKGKLPKMIGIEIQGCDPINQAIKRNKDFYVLDNIPHSAAKAIAAREAFSSPKAIRAIKESNGEIIVITEEELLTEVANVKNIKEISPCISSVSVLAGLRKYNGNGNVVCVLSG